MPKFKQRTNQMAAQNLLAPYQKKLEEQSQAEESEDEAEDFSMSSGAESLAIPEISVNESANRPLAIRVSTVSMFTAEEKAGQTQCVERVDCSNNI